MGIEIYAPIGEIIYSAELSLPSTGSMTIVPGDENFDMAKWLIQNGGYGNYKSVWSLDGKYAGSTEFEIVPSGK